jgi:hypothetical protein
MKIADPLYALTRASKLINKEATMCRLKPIDDSCTPPPSTSLPIRTSPRPLNDRSVRMGAQGRHQAQQTTSDFLFFLSLTYNRAVYNE